MYMAVVPRPVVHPHVYTMRDRLALIAKMIDSSMSRPQESKTGQKYMIRDLALEIVSGTAQHGEAAENQQLAAIFKWVKANVEYRQDPRDYDQYMAAGRTIAAGGSDCFTLDTKVIVRSKLTGCYELCSLGELRSTWSAYDALSYDFDRTEWTFKPITQWVSKGVKEVLDVHLSNGPHFRCTPDHQIWFWDGQNNTKRIEQRAIGEVIDETRDYYRRAVVARRIPALGVSDFSESLAYLTGIYAAEGYHDSKKTSHGVCIAQDRGDIREKIEHHLSSIGVVYSPSKRLTHAYYRLSAKDPTARLLHAQGGNSFDMTFGPDALGCSEEALKTIIEAHADGDAYIPKEGSRWASKVKAIHATSSVELSEELQLVSMILGEAWYCQKQVHHGGAGTKPIYRFHRWLDDTQPGRRVIQSASGLGYSHLQDVTPAGEDEVCCISVADTHNFVLSNGLVVHNCDDHTILINSLATSIGFMCGAKIVSPDGAGWHIYSVVGIHPFHAPKKYLAMDTTQPGSFPGWEPGIDHRRFELMTTFTRGGFSRIKMIRWEGRELRDQYLAGT